MKSTELKVSGSILRQPFLLHDGQADFAGQPLHLQKGPCALSYVLLLWLYAAAIRHAYPASVLSIYAAKATPTIDCCTVTTEWQMRRAD